MSKSKSFHRLHQSLGVAALLPLILFLDSPWLAERIPHNQWLANAATIAYFAWIFATASLRLRKLMLLGLVVATAGEALFALVIGMYEYRLENVPIYVPPGHTLVYAAVYYLTREPWVRRHAEQIRNVCLTIAVGFSLYWLWAQNDVYGALCTGVFMAIVAINRDSRLFFPIMYVFVLYLELIGTSIGNWYWHPVLLDRWEAIPSGNPPAGISVFYFGFDIACLGLYMLTNLKIRARYDAQKAYRKRLRRGAVPERAVAVPEVEAG